MVDEVKFFFYDFGMQTSTCDIIHATLALTYLTTNELWTDFFLYADIPSRMILSHVDKLDMCVYGDLTKLFVSRHVQRKVELAKVLFKLQDIQVLPVANYVKGITQNIAQDILALQAIENILNETISYVGNSI